MAVDVAALAPGGAEPFKLWAGVEMLVVNVECGCTGVHLLEVTLPVVCAIDLVVAFEMFLHVCWGLDLWRWNGVAIQKIRWDAECDWSGVITKLYGRRGFVYCDASF